MSARRRVTVPPPVLDILLTAMALAAQLAPFVSTEPTGGRDHWPWAMYVPVVAAGMPLLWRRRAPFAVLAATVAASEAYKVFPLGPPQPVWYALLIAIFTVAVQGPRWQRVVVLAGIAVASVALSGSLATSARGVVMDVAAYAMGRAWAARRLHAEMLVERAGHLEREKDLAVERERSRIALDLHDILAHGVSVMIAQAQAGTIDVRRDPDRAEASFDAIADVGRDAMAQLRRVVSSADPSAEQPLLSALPDLAARVSTAGPAVTVSGTGAAVPLPADVEAAAYRIVQEALTNAVKHARATMVEVRLDWHASGLVLSIDDDGRGPGEATGAHRRGEHGGHGLIGIRERARACGGTASFGPGPHGRGYRVTARLPARLTASAWPGAAATR